MASDSLPARDLLEAYTGQVRLRVCGLLVHNGTLLLTAHRGLLPDARPFWSPPGGGWQFGETIQECLRREFREETGLEVVVGRFLHLHEYRSDDLQALELFFEVTPTDPTAVPRLGSDPEHAADAQLLTELAFVSTRQLVVLPAPQVHPVLRQIISTDDVFIPQVRFQR
ncbi:NUDIX domain-containing protein [Hymenobacter psychrotolerans]|uniref:NUDIX domain-containing protein n=1 Tax=Hymenobacter psychrotolerans DSM 18569 TaxID=1121959 RepID=A0A1M6Y848_9BACT|nr:NUDIX hydrolase [Hymenobacter psychrotolerans]SHL14436.1 NUDIX domain-containing protein [Hymenobacter psychrotolerans DSM 18569]